MAADEVLVVVVDDSDDAAATLACALELDGYTVRTARDGQHALELIEAQTPHCVLFDIDMPRLDGWELAKRLRERYRDDIVLIAVTASTGKDARAVGTFAIADHYLFKPVDPKRLGQLLPPLRR